MLKYLTVTGGPTVPSTAPRSQRPIGAWVLVALGVVMVFGGLFVIGGAAGPESEVGELGHPIVWGFLMLGLAALYLWAGLAALGRRPGATKLLIASLMAIAGQLAYRLLMFGVIGFGDALVCLVVAALLIHERALSRHRAGLTDNALDHGRTVP